MAPIGRIIAGILGEKISQQAQKSATMQSIARETAKLERQGVAGAANVVVAAGVEIQKDVSDLWNKLKRSLSTPAEGSSTQQMLNDRSTASTVEPNNDNRGKPSGSQK
jgi:hypothetical protein